MQRDKALVVLSGGADSATCLFWAKQKFKEVHSISFDYGQRHVIELQSARKVSSMAGAYSHEVVEVKGDLKSISPLTSNNELDRYVDHASMVEEVGDRIEKTFVPMRNFLFFTIAANRAIALGCGDIVTGICEADEQNYPDCTEVFLKFFQAAANLSLGVSDDPREGLMFHAPLQHKSKAESVKLARSLPGCWEALAYTTTSYDGKYPPTDMNHSNILRAHGFEVAGLPDPLVLRAHSEGLMQLPSTANYDTVRGVNQ